MKFFRLFVLVALCSVPVLFSSCQKTTQIGSNVIPGGDFIYAVTTDTFTVLAQEEAELPVPTSSLSKYLLGSMRDPVFGNSYAAIFTQVQIPGGGGETFVNLGNSISIDSIVLSLPYYASTSYYGIPKTPQSIKVYQVTQSMLPGTVYNSNQPFSFDPQPIGAINNYIPDFIDSPRVWQAGVLDTVPPQLRIKLSAAFAQELLSQSGTGTFNSNSAFQNFLKGILIAPDTSNGFGAGIMYFDLTTAAINVYCSQTSSTGSGPINVQFPINSSAYVATDYYKHNYNGTPIANLLKTDSSNNSVLYIQSMGGLRAKITIPHLKSLGNVLINKAQLEVIQIHSGSSTPIIDSNFSAPQALELLTDSLNTNYSIEDISSDFLTYGGTRIKTAPATNDTIWEYNVNVSDQIQYLLTGNPTNSTVNYSQFSSLFLRTFPNPEIADRIVIGGGNSSKSKLVLHLVYTKLK